MAKIPTSSRTQRPFSILFPSKNVQFFSRFAENVRFCEVVCASKTNNFGTKSHDFTINSPQIDPRIFPLFPSGLFVWPLSSRRCQMPGSGLPNGFWRTIVPNAGRDGLFYPSPFAMPYLMNGCAPCPGKYKRPTMLYGFRLEWDHNIAWLLGPYPLSSPAKIISSRQYRIVSSSS